MNAGLGSGNNAWFVIDHVWVGSSGKEPDNISEKNEFLWLIVPWRAKEAEIRK